MPRKFVFAVVLLGLAGVMITWSLAHRSDSHDKMLQLLQDVRQRTAEENTYLGDAELRKVADQLSITSTPDRLQRVPLLWKQGVSLLRLGRTDEAIEVFRSIDDLMPELRTRMPAKDFDEFELSFIRQFAIAHLRKGDHEFA